MSRTTRLAFLAAVIAAASMPAVSYAAQASLTPTRNATFPDREMVFTLPAGVVPAGDEISVVENGEQVSGLTVTAPGVKGNKSFGVMLVIDASRTMRGRAIQGAMAAARAFASQRPEAQPLGVVTFNDTATVLSSPTTDRDTIAGVLAGPPPLGSGTRIHHAVATALKQLDRPGLDGGAVVVLSDGCRLVQRGCEVDRGASAEVAAAARAVNGEVFSVGLRSRSFNPAVLREMAAKGGGSYVGSASARSLEGIYRRLGGQLANAYVLRYSSLARPGTTVEVVAEARGERASMSYVAPALRVGGAVAHKRGQRREEGSFVSSWAGVLVVTVAFLLLMFVAVAVLLIHRQGKHAVRRRVGEYGLPAVDTDTSGPAQPAGMAAPRSLADKEWWNRLEEALEIGRIPVPATRLVTVVALAMLVAAWIAVALTGSALFAPVALAGVPLLARAYVRNRVRRQRRRFADQLADSMQAVASAMRTGHSFVAALSMLVDEAPEPTATEFRRVLADERLGVPLEDAFGEVVRRMDNRDLEQVALISVLQRETGGNGAEALDRVVENLRGRDEVRRLVQTLTAQGRMSRWVLTGLPICLALALTVMGGDYMDPLFQTGLGHVMLVVAATLVTAGSMVIQKIVEIDV